MPFCLPILSLFICLFVYLARISLISLRTSSTPRNMISRKSLSYVSNVHKGSKFTYLLQFLNKVHITESKTKSNDNIVFNSLGRS